VPVESWRIDDLVIAKIGGSLGKRAAVRRITYQKEVFCVEPMRDAANMDGSELGTRSSRRSAPASL